jgi:hypothetical protein
MRSIEPAHDDQPVDDRSLTVDGEARWLGCQRQYIEIDIARQPAVQVELGAAGRLPTLHGREIEVREPYRLLQLVDPVAGKEHTGHMGFVQSHPVHGVRVGLRLGKERDLITQADVGIVGLGRRALILVNSPCGPARQTVGH